MRGPIDAFASTVSTKPNFIMLVFLSTRDLRDAWADRREILHDGQC